MAFFCASASVALACSTSVCHTAGSAILRVHHWQVAIFVAEAEAWDAVQLLDDCIGSQAVIGVLFGPPQPPRGSRLRRRGPFHRRERGELKEEPPRDARCTQRGRGRGEEARLALSSTHARQARRRQAAGGSGR